LKKKIICFNYFLF